MLASTSRLSASCNLDFSVLKLNAQRKLFTLLDKFDGTKTIIWDDKLIGPFEFVANASLLKQHDVTRLFRLSDIEVSFNAKTDYVLYFISKDYHVAKCVANILIESDRLSLAKTSLVFVPQRCASRERFLEDLKVDLSKLNSIEELNINLYVLDTDLISIENENVFSDLYLRDDHSYVRQIVDGLMELQDVVGQIPRISGQGRAAKLVCDLLLKRRKLNPPTKQNVIPQINQLVLIDRRIDLVTPLLTQLTYEGLLDEVFGINHGTITLPAEKFNQYEEKERSDKKDPPKVSEPPAKTKRFELRSSEELFAKLRDCHINAVADVLKQSAKNLQLEYEHCSSEGKTIHEMGKIVKRLNHLKIAKKSQSNHVTIAELVNEQTLIPEFIYGLRIEHELLQEDKLNRVIPEIDNKLLRLENPLHILRLICLHSLINNGLKPKVADYYKKELIQNYGIDYAAFLIQLERANLLLCHERFYETGSFSHLKNRFNLIRDDVNECNPNHLSYVYGGYAPLSVVITRLMSQFSIGPQWRLISESLPEPIINYYQPVHSNQHALANGGQAQQVTSLHPSESSGSLANAAASFLMSASAVMATNAAGIRVRRNSATSSQSSSEETKTVLVFFIGGCTYAEISTLRFLSQQEENNCEFVVATTKIINGRTFLASLWPKSGYKNSPSVIGFGLADQ